MSRIQTLTLVVELAEQRRDEALSEHASRVRELQAAQEAVLEDAYVLIHEKKISSLKDMLPLLEKVAKTGRPLKGFQISMKPLVARKPPRQRGSPVSNGSHGMP